MGDWRQSIYREAERRGENRRKEGESDREIGAKSLFTARKDKANLYRGLPRIFVLRALRRMKCEPQTVSLFQEVAGQ